MRGKWRGPRPHKAPGLKARFFVQPDGVCVERDRRTVSHDLREIIWARDGGRCTYCHQKVNRHFHRRYRRGLDHEIDHALPRSRGGQVEIGNLRLTCYACNRKKRARTPDEWKAIA